MMTIIILLVVFSLLLALLFLSNFLWAVRSGQYDDNITPAMRMLNDDPPPQGEVFREKHTAIQHQDLQTQKHQTVT